MLLTALKDSLEKDLVVMTGGSQVLLDLSDVNNFADYLY